jgi:hypothetical protein
MHTLADHEVIAGANRHTGLAHGIGVPEHVDVLHREAQHGQLGHMQLECVLLAFPHRAQPILRDGPRAELVRVGLHAHHLDLDAGRHNALARLDQVARCKDLVSDIVRERARKRGGKKRERGVAGRREEDKVHGKMGSDSTTNLDGDQQHLVLELGRQRVKRPLALELGLEDVPAAAIVKEPSVVEPQWTI